jgi:hypothetical protein
MNVLLCDGRGSFCPGERALGKAVGQAAESIGQCHRRELADITIPAPRSRQPSVPPPQPQPAAAARRRKAGVTRLAADARLLDTRAPPTRHRAEHNCQAVMGHLCAHPKALGLQHKLVVVQRPRCSRCSGEGGHFWWRRGSGRSRGSSAPRYSSPPHFVPVSRPVSSEAPAESPARCAPKAACMHACAPLAHSGGAQALLAQPPPCLLARSWRPAAGTAGRNRCTFLLYVSHFSKFRSLLDAAVLNTRCRARSCRAGPHPRVESQQVATMAG